MLVFAPTIGTLCTRQTLREKHVEAVADRSVAEVVRQSRNLKQQNIPGREVQLGLRVHQVRGKALCEITNAQTVLEAVVTGTGKDAVAHPQLLYITQSLKFRRVDDAEFNATPFGVSVNTVENSFCHAASLGTVNACHCSQQQQFYC